MVSKRIEDLHPDMQPLCRQWLQQCTDGGLDVRILITYRTAEEQDRLYAQGRTAPGKIVTNLKGSASKHCFTINCEPAAKAFDFGVFEGAKYITDGHDERYFLAGKLGENLGLTWGGSFKSIFDPSHLEIP